MSTKNVRSRQNKVTCTFRSDNKPAKKAAMAKPSNVGDRKTTSTGEIAPIKTSKVSKPKKTTQSEWSFDQRIVYNKTIDVCKNCGDHDKLRDVRITKTVESNPEIALKERNKAKLVTGTGSKKIGREIGQEVNSTEYLHQFYKNDKFFASTESVFNNEHSRKYPELDTIKEMPETTTNSCSRETDLIKIYSETNKEEDLGLFDVDNTENIKKMKEFRNENYFECHSAKARLSSNEDDDRKHKCSYRFYLNSRLFPVPISADHHKTIRCTQCQLPFEDKHSGEDSTNNGTIQAKVKIADENGVQDLTLLLPVKEPLIIKERRKEIDKERDREVVYFGVIKLSPDGNSIFNPIHRNNSFALKYQKGYREFNFSKEVRYEELNEKDIIII